ncbi:unnamed protein product [Orchesella dallaii]|uniref:Uncharacterized protein n=1 Tax=Orchesella dallaii TaxID=48710 RepID=A0ABP1RDC2_9HEXA
MQNSNLLMTQLATIGFHQMLRFGCGTKIIPYTWDSKRNKLQTASKLGVAIFHLHKNVMYFLVVFTTSRLIQACKRGMLPLQQMLLTSAWIHGYLLTAIGFSQFPGFRHEIMQFGNLVLERIHNPSAGEPMNMKPTRKERKHLSWHMYIGLFLVITNPALHSMVTEQSPCAPIFISSTFFECRTVSENIVPFVEKAPFLVFELYGVSLFLYMGWFNWGLILVGLSTIASELRSMGRNTKLLLGTRNVTFRFRKMHIIVLFLNSTFRSYLTCFGTILYSVVAQLLFGSIRLLHRDPRANMMFPLCGFRCGFEVTTPLALASNVSQESKNVLVEWRSKMDTAVKQNWKGRKELRMAQRSCKRILCSAGSLYTFDHSIVLCSVDNCIQLTFNLLCTFGEDLT